MSIYQCDNCGCADNTATGWYWERNRESLNTPETLGKALCSACAPTHYPNGDRTEFNGTWTSGFERMFLPHNSCFTNDQGNLEHHETGLVGNVLYAKLGRSDPYPKDGSE